MIRSSAPSLPDFLLTLRLAQNFSMRDLLQYRDFKLGQYRDLLIAELLSTVCHHVLALLMKKPLSTTSQCFANLFLTALLLVSLSVSSGAGLRDANQVSPGSGQAEPTSIRSAENLFRAHALTSFQSQRIASETAKQKRAKHPLPHQGPLPRKFAAQNTTVRRHLVAGNRSVYYLSFRFSCPLGRAPPPSA